MKAHNPLLPSRALAATDPQAGVRASKVNVTALVTLALVALIVYGFDQLTKFVVVTHLAENEQVSAVGDLLQFHFVKNSGAAFSIAAGSTWIFTIAATAVTIFIVGFARRIRSIGWAILFGMLLGGTTGNLTDRLLRQPGFGVGHVVDFIQVYGFPAIFNIADSFIVASMGLFIILTIRGVGLDGRRLSHTTRFRNPPQSKPLASITDTGDLEHDIRTVDAPSTDARSVDLRSTDAPEHT